MASEPLMWLPESARRHAERVQQDRQPAPLPAITPAEAEGILAIWPRCAVCQRPVEKLSWTADPGTDALTFTVRCHGAVEHTSIPRAAALRGEMPIAGGMAFAAPAITSEPSHG
jgi:hypothetical protein